MSAIFYSGPSIAELHDKYAKNGRIDPNAPLKASAKTEIHAPIDTVWTILSDVESWPSWRPSVKDARVETEVARDHTFRWKSGGARMRSTLAVVEPRRELSWTGRAAHLRGVHRVLLEETGTGTVLATTEESMAGLFLPLLFSEAKLRRELESLLADLKRAAENV